MFSHACAYPMFAHVQLKPQHLQHQRKYHPMSSLPYLRCIITVCHAPCVLLASKHTACADPCITHAQSSFWHAACTFLMARNGSLHGQHCCVSFLGLSREAGSSHEVHGLGRLAAENAARHARKLEVVRAVASHAYDSLRPQRISQTVSSKVAACCP